ncbi:MAG: hypothetical protein D6693_08195 [Planctomycetota bacterium]|nr:MAG: hypothetical protein D6693_08195 [Planctomycetota bacterium]
MIRVEHGLDDGARVSGLWDRAARNRTGLTIIELLVSISIMAVLLALLGPAVIRTMGSARSFRCQTTLRGIGFDFALYADPLSGGAGGASSTRFNMVSFVDREYGLANFWGVDSPQDNPASGAPTPRPTTTSTGGVHIPSLAQGQRGLGSPGVRPGDDAHAGGSSATALIGEHLQCAEVASVPIKHAGRSCTRRDSVTPVSDLSYTFNSRLYERVNPQRGNREEVVLTERILQQSAVPLAWDVDGADAMARGARTPHFTSAPVDGEIPGLHVWAPDPRHGGRINVVFVDGHVESSADPVHEPVWDWASTPG